MGGIFGRRCRHSDNSGAIRALIASNEENHRRFLALMEKYEKSHSEQSEGSVSDLGIE